MGRWAALHDNTALDAFIILLIGCSAASVTATQSSNLTLNKWPRNKRRLLDRWCHCTYEREIISEQNPAEVNDVFTVHFDMNDAQTTHWSAPQK